MSSWKRRSSPTTASPARRYTSRAAGIHCGAWPSAMARCRPGWFCTTTPMWISVRCARGCRSFFPGWSSSRRAEALPVTGLKARTAVMPIMAAAMPNFRNLKALGVLLCGLLGIAGTVRADGVLRPVIDNALVQGESQALPTVTRVVVYKGDRRMDLMRGNDVVRSFRVSLGLVPEGHKERAGDFRTPEGRYYLTRRNPRSDFFLSIQVSYPNDRDQRH